MGDPWGIGVLVEGGGEGLEGANRKKKLEEESENKISTGNGLKSIGNSKKSL